MAYPEQLNDNALLKRLEQGDMDAYESIFTRYYGTL